MPCSPGMSACKRMCQHRELVSSYRSARLAAELAREESTRGFATELAEYPPIVTFKSWLLGMRRSQ